jgi:hypothetical protein
MYPQFLQQQQKITSLISCVYMYNNIYRSLVRGN